MHLWRRTPLLLLNLDETPGGAVVEGTPDAQTPAADATPDWANPPALPFELDSIENEEHREYLRVRAAQLQSGFGKAVHTVQDQLKTVQPHLALLAKLEDPATRNEALAEFLAQYDVELELGDDEPVTETTPQTPAAIPDEVREELAASRQFREEIEQREAAKTAAELHQRKVQTLRSGLDAFAKAEGTEFDQLPQPVVDDILARATALPPSEGGMPNIEQAIADYIVHRDLILSSAEEKARAKAEAKDVPTPDLTSQDADPAPPAEGRSKQQRLAAALAVAGRHSV